MGSVVLSGSWGLCRVGGGDYQRIVFSFFVLSSHGHTYL